MSLGCQLLISPVANFQFDEMLAAIIHQGNGFFSQFFAIEKELIRLGSIGCQTADGDVENSLAVAVMDFTDHPAFRQTRS